MRIIMNIFVRFFIFFLVPTATFLLHASSEIILEDGYKAIPVQVSEDERYNLIVRQDRDAKSYVIIDIQTSPFFLTKETLTLVASLKPEMKLADHQMTCIDNLIQIAKKTNKLDRHDTSLSPKSNDNFTAWTLTEEQITRIQEIAKLPEALPQNIKNTAALKIQTVYADSRNPTTFDANITPTPSEIEIDPIEIDGTTFTHLKGTKKTPTLIRYSSDDSTSTKEILRFEFSNNEGVKKIFDLSFDAKSHDIFSLITVDGDNSSLIEFTDLENILKKAIKELKTNLQLPKSLKLDTVRLWTKAPEIASPPSLDGFDSSYVIPSGASLATAVTVATLIYTGETTETMSAIGSGIMDALPLAKIHAFLEEKAPLLLKKKKLAALSLATLAVIINHTLTSTQKTRFQPALGQIAQLSLCGWLTFRTVEKLLTQLNQ